ncbi:unnamed protein product [Brachionus calyciflorus]|uniref:Uncharacterized protein n=1 Tax=Brachionus calyciflorus TaxID=104777 RepID=A0A813M8W6_9BILA|nr:unnamed protein product [Brachionus calyciflorus]
MILNFLLISWFTFITHAQDTNRHDATPELTISRELNIKNLIELNNLLESEIIFKNLTLTKYLVANIEFNFSHKLISKINLHVLNQMEIILKNFSTYNQKNSHEFMYKKFDLFLLSPNNSNLFHFNSSVNNRFCDKKFNKYLICYKKAINTTSHDVYILESLSFKLNKTGSLVLCTKILPKNNPDLVIFTENMCINWIAFNKTYHKLEVHNFQYKPLFIVLMYILCGSVLVPIAVFQHLDTKSRSKLKIRIEEATDCDVSEMSCSSLKKSSTKSLKKDNSNKDLLSPLIERKHSESQKVMFDLKELDEEKCDREVKHFSKIIDAADHILDDKPWLSNSSIIETYNEESFSQTQSGLFQLEDKKDQDLIKKSCSKSSLQKTVFYESNV